MNLTGDESFLVGLSPSYWAHVPMLANQIAALACTSIDTNQAAAADGVLRLCHQNQQQQQQTGCQYPISKCSIVGYIIYAERRATSRCYIVDDGTGLVDCVQWMDHEEDLLLPLVGSEKTTLQPNFPIGSLVRVQGKIILKAAHNNNNKTCEIHITTITSISETEEYQHWLRCVDHQTALNLTTPMQVLEWLGDKIIDQVSDRANLPSADDTLGAWRLFGVHCSCSGIIKEELLYCQCIAKPEPLDPNLAFRQNVLKWLLQSRRAKFSYSDVAQESTLVQFATSQTTSSHQCTTLMRNTFLCLRHDGILYLLDPATDVYLLITRRHVLEPFVQQQQQQQQQHAEQWPRYLERVPKVKLQIVRRGLFLRQRQETGTDNDNNNK